MERIWDRYLSERDRSALAARPRRDRVPFGSRPAVLSIDNYRAVAGDQPMELLEMISTWPQGMGRTAWEALEQIALLLRAAREAGVPCLHVTGLSEEESGVPHRSGSKNTDPTPEGMARHARRFEIMPQAAPAIGEVVLKKTAPSAFFGTPLMAALNGMDVDTLIVVGESTSGCVRATVADAKAYRFTVVVVEECVYDRYEAPHAINLFDMDLKYATVLPLSDVVAWLAARATSSA